MKNTITAIALLFLAFTCKAQFYQQCPKLTCTGLPANASFGNSASISADAATAIVGAWGGANGATGNAVIYNRNGSVWTQGQILEGAGAIGGANQGASVAMSADGNTAIVGGPSDDNDAGAAWIFIRSGNSWTEQTKLIGIGATGNAFQGFSVALSGDGNTAVVGGPSDNNGTGAAWVFTRSGNNWSQLDSKLVGSGTVSSGGQQGYSVAISKNKSVIAVGAIKDGFGSDGAVWIYRKVGSSYIQEQKVTGSISYLGASLAFSVDGSRLVIGAPKQNSKQGGAAVVSYNGTIWTAENNGNYLVGALPVGRAQQGGSVSISDDGNIVVIGGAANVLPPDQNDIGLGACWVFTRSGSLWIPQGNKYVGTGNSGNCRQGASVAMSADGNTFITGGFGDDNSTGAIWVFSKTIPPITGIDEASLPVVSVYPILPKTAFISNLLSN